MNDDSVNDAIDRPVTLDNEATPDAIFFVVAAPAVTAAAIAPDAHFVSSGLKLDTEIFSKRNIKNLADKDTIDTTPDPNANDSDTHYAAAQYDGSTDSNYLYSLRNHKPPPLLHQHHEKSEK